MCVRILRVPSLTRATSGSHIQLSPIAFAVSCAAFLLFRYFLDLAHFAREARGAKALEGNNSTYDHRAFTSIHARLSFAGVFYLPTVWISGKIIGALAFIVIMASVVANGSISARLTFARAFHRFFTQRANVISGAMAFKAMLAFGQAISSILARLTFAWVHHAYYLAVRAR